MASVIRIARSLLLSSSSSSKSMFPGVPRYKGGSFAQSRDSISALLFQSRPYAADTLARSPFEANIIRILDNEIEYQAVYAPPHQPPTEYESFKVEDHPGGQWITMRGQFGDNERIKMDATMFDGAVSVPVVEDDSSGEDMRLHITLLVDIFKGDGSDKMEFVCSAWPDSIEIQKVYILKGEKKLARPYMGADFRNMKSDLQKTLHNFLEARGVNDELSVFLHQYMMNKDRMELIRWLVYSKSVLQKK